MKNFNILGVNWKIHFLGRLRGDCLKGGGLDSLQIGKKEGQQRAWQERGIVFLWGVDTPMRTVPVAVITWNSKILYVDYI